ncbi:hypothetical protein [Streptomyces alfalfae]
MTDTTTPHGTELQLPPYSGHLAVCAKCGHGDVSTEYQPPLPPRTIRRTDTGIQHGPLPERQQRSCDWCSYTWDEAVGVEPTLPTPLTETELAYALDNSTPYPVELHPHVAAAMATSLAKMLTAYPRPGHAVWDVDVPADRPEETRPTPAEDVPPTEASAAEEVSGE